MSASDQLVRIGNGRMLHLLASYSFFGQTTHGGIHGRAACGVRGSVTSRWLLDIDVLRALEACPRCTDTARQCAGMLADHRSIFGGAS